VRWPMRPGGQSNAQHARELAAQEAFEPGARAPSLGSDHALERGTMFQETWRSAPVPGRSATCGVHGLQIDSVSCRLDPWRE
jgi:hypothetical protein